MEKWITVNGNHILIKDGQTVEEALAERFDSFEEDNGVDSHPGSGQKDLGNALLTSKEIIQRKVKRSEKIDENDLLERAKNKYALTEEELEILKNKISKYCDKLNIEFDSTEKDNGVDEPKKRGYYKYWIDDKNGWAETTTKEEYYNTPKKRRREIEFVELNYEALKTTEEELTNIINNVISSDDGVTSRGSLEEKIRTKLKQEGYFNNRIHQVIWSYEDEISNAWAKKRPAIIEKGKEALSTLPTTEKGKLYESIDYANLHVGSRYRNNCYKCAQAFDLRMRGYDISAGPSSYDEKDHRIPDVYNNENKAGWGMMMYIEPEGGLDYYGYDYTFGDVINWKKNNKGRLKQGGPAQFKQIKEIVSKGPDNAIYQCGVAWQSGSAHVFNIMKKGGQVRFIDVQSADVDEDVERYFNSGNIRTSKTMLVRVDNLDINENCLKVIYGEND